MRRVGLISVFLVSVSAATPVWAVDAVVPARPLQSNGALIEGGAWNSSSLSHGSVSLFGWGANYQIDAGPLPSLSGAPAAGIGATVGSASGWFAPDYGVHLGAGSAGNRFTVNPFSRFGLSEVQGPAYDVNLGFTVSQSITPNLSLTGAAEAHRAVGASAFDPLNGVSEIVIGAGLGLRF